MWSDHRETDFFFQGDSPSRFSCAGNSSTSECNPGRDLAACLSPGSSAVFGLVCRSTRDKVLPEIGKFGGTVLHTSLSHELEAEFQAALDDLHRNAVAVQSATLRPDRSRARRIVRRRD